MADVLQKGGSGRQVVDSVLGLINSSIIFPSDHGFLRKVAWVSSRFGLNASLHLNTRRLGIWQLSDNQLADTKDTLAHEGLRKVHQSIQDWFGIDWKPTIFMDMEKPLFAGLAASLFLSTKSQLPPAGDQEQAHYWATYFGPLALSQQFLNAVGDIPTRSHQEEKCTTESLYNRPPMIGVETSYKGKVA